MLRDLYEIITEGRPGATFMNRELISKSRLENRYAMKCPVEVYFLLVKKGGTAKLTPFVLL